MILHPPASGPFFTNRTAEHTQQGFGDLLLKGTTTLNDKHIDAAERLRKRRAGEPIESGGFKVLATKPAETADFKARLTRLPNGTLTFPEWQALKRANGTHWWYSAAVQHRVAIDAKALGAKFWEADSDE